MKIACAVIVGDNAEKKDWDRMVSSLVDNRIEALFVNYNGSKRKFPYSKKFDIDIIVEHNEWNDDFSDARNKSFEMIPQEDFDWIMWIDTDDKLMCHTDIHELLKAVEPEIGMVITEYHYGIEQETKAVIVNQKRERFLRTGNVWRWQYPIHEVCTGPPGFRSIISDKVWIEHYRTEGIGDTATRERNRRIIAKARKANPDVPRFDNYMANEIFAEATVTDDKEEQTNLLNTAIKLWKDFIGRTDSEDEAYIANSRIATCYRMQEDYNAAIDTDLQCVKIRPHWPDAYNGISESYMQAGNYEMAARFAQMCLNNTETPETFQVQEPLNLVYKPKLMLALCAEKAGDTKKAIRYYTECAGMSCASPEIENKIEELRNWKPKPKQDIVPDFVSENRGKRREKSIAFFTAPLFEPWHPEYEKVSGSGGAEKCIMELAPRFAADGWRVAVFGTPGDYIGIDEHGVEWYDTQKDWVNGDPFTVIVSSRYPGLFQAKQNCDLSLVWLHDVNGGPDFFKGQYGNIIESVDGVITLTDWHKNHTQLLYGINEEKLSIIPNGISLDRFDAWQQPKVTNKFVWSSSPDRGIDTLLQMWPDIRKEFDDAQLHVFYGWDAIDKIIKTNPDSFRSRQLEHFKYGVMNEISRLNADKEDIFWHGRMPQAELAKHQMTCDRWIYPTHFMETFCITALEMQAAGVIPMTSSLAALNETVASTHLTIPGAPNNTSMRTAFIKRLVETQNESEDYKAVRRLHGREFAESFSWDNAYAVWMQYINDRISLPSGGILASSGATV